MTDTGQPRELPVTADDLDAAVARREFVVQFQPKVERMDDGGEWRTTEAEALIRWRHPQHGLLGPGAFLPAATRLGRIAELDELVLRSMLRNLSRWRERGLELKGCINLAPAELADAALPWRYAQIVEQYGLECGDITLEIAESAVVEPDFAGRRVVAALRRQGFRISLDDFGAAASSLKAFGSLEFDEIKIDATMLAHARASEMSRKALAAITGLAHSSGITVCAEGVEDEETLAFLREIRCDKMQGFLISAAVMPEIIRSCYPAVAASAA
jgi:EAL domain-containing protein (putative c-di-GMP-specific phosphodiesterase class I)